MNKEKELAEKRAISLAASKLYNDYMILRSSGIYPELEYFFEIWSRRSLIRVTEGFKSAVFRIFLNMLCLRSHG
jgi:hypothetical protein